MGQPRLRARLRKDKETYYAPKQKLSINLANDLSDHSAELLWGQGHLITHSNEKANERLQEITKINKSEEFLPYNEKLLSLYGNMYWTIDMVNGTPVWTLADPTLNSLPVNAENGSPSADTTMAGLGRALVFDVIAVIWKRITYGTVNFPIKEIHYPDRVERIFFGENGKRVNVAAVNKVIPEELQLTPLWEHNIGLIDGQLPTVQWSKNLPTFNAPSLADGYKGHSLQILVDKTMSELYHETETNRTRIIGNMDETSYNQLMKNGDLAEINKNDFLINVKMKNSTGNAENQLIPILADPKFDMYWLSIQKAKDEYFQLGGYSPLGDGSTEKTATENILMKTNDYQTTKKKRNQRMLEITAFIKKTLIMDKLLGFGDIYEDIENDFDNLVSIEIMENKVVDSMKEMENYEKMYALGVISRVEMIANIRGITKEEAKTIQDEIDAELKLDKEALGEEEENKEEDNGEKDA